jgi:nucleotide-binding universal stress UspA family protein
VAKLKVLIAIDGSPFAQAAIDSVAARLWPPDAVFMVLHVVPELAPSYFAFNYGYVEALARVHDAGRATGKKIVDDAVEALSSKLPDAEITGSLCDGTAARGIVEAAKQWGADLIYCAR